MRTDIIKFFPPLSQTAVGFSSRFSFHVPAHQLSSRTVFILRLIKHVGKRLNPHRLNALMDGGSLPNRMKQGVIGMQKTLEYGLCLGCAAFLRGSRCRYASTLFASCGRGNIMAILLDFFWFNLHRGVKYPYVFTYQSNEKMIRSKTWMRGKQVLSGYYRQCPKDGKPKRKNLGR
jgi:hypothetical protein